LKIALIGADGQLGTDINNYFKEKGLGVAGLTQEDIEVCDFNVCDEVLKKIKPDLIINTAAFHRVNLCEDEVLSSFKVNALGVKNLAKICLDLDIPLMHFSTDFVFGGDKSIWRG